MNYKEKRAFLESYQRAKRRTLSLLNESEQWTDIGQRINQQYSAAPSSGRGDSKPEKASVNVVDILRQVELELSTAEEERSNITNAIESKSGKLRHREILKMRFINGMSINKMAHLLKKDTKTISNAINAAIHDLDI